LHNLSVFLVVEEVFGIVENVFQAFPQGGGGDFGHFTVVFVEEVDQLFFVVFGTVLLHPGVEADQTDCLLVASAHGPFLPEAFAQHICGFKHFILLFGLLVEYLFELTLDEGFGVALLHFGARLGQLLENFLHGLVVVALLGACAVQHRVDVEHLLLFGLHRNLQNGEGEVARANFLVFLGFTRIVDFPVLLHEQLNTRVLQRLQLEFRNMHEQTLFKLFSGIVADRLVDFA